NFQTATTVTPTGYLPDTGSAFGDRANGFSYGWWNSPDNGTTAVPTTDPSTRERNVNPDKRLDTIVQLHKVGESPAVGMVWWEINVPNGTYQVHLVAGDASNADEYLSFEAESAKNAGGVPQVGTGTVLIHKDMNGGANGNFADSGTIDVTVNHGNLPPSQRR